MGLDAYVYCNCVETGQLLVPHPFPERLVIEADGGPELRSDDLDELLTHDLWLHSSPCRHDACCLVSYRLGNMALIGRIRCIVQRLSRDVEDHFPVLWSKVIYSGIHCGDYLTPPEVSDLAVELAQLRVCAADRLDKENTEYLQVFLSKLDELIQASRSVQKPIVL